MSYIIFGNFTFGKLLLGKLYFRKMPFGINSLGKDPLVNYLLGNQTFRELEST